MPTAHGRLQSLLLLLYAPVLKSTPLEMGTHTGKDSS